MRLPRSIAEQIVAHARRDAPNECCGMVGQGGTAGWTLYPATNAEASPLRYSIDAREQLQIMRAMEDGGQELAAIYHSHTKSPATPSQTDVNLAFWPDAVYLIVSLAEPGEPELRGFEIDDGEVSEVELHVG